MRVVVERAGAVDKSEQTRVGPFLLTAANLGHRHDQHQCGR
jgi:hypothetical protein